MITFLTEEETGTLRELALERQITVNTFVQAAWALMLHLYSGRDDVLFGITVAGRPADVAAMQATVGLFISSIPLRVRLPHPATGQSTADWLAELQGQNLAMREHEHLPLVTIAECSELPRGTPLFDSLFVFESEPVNFSLADGAEEPVCAPTRCARTPIHPLTVVIYPGDTLGLHYSYDRRFLDDADAGAAGTVQAAVAALGRRFRQAVRDLRLLDATARHVSCGRQRHRARLPAGSGLRALFRATVRHHPIGSPPPAWAGA